MPPVLTAASCDALCGSGAGGGGGIVDFDLQRLATGGNVTLNSTGGFVAVPSLGSATVDATAGDLIEVAIQGAVATTNASTSNVRFDAATLVSASPVNYLSGLTGDSGDAGVMGWLSNAVALFQLTGSVFYVVQSGDIATGTVTVGLRYRTEGANQLVLLGGSTQPTLLQVVNYGQVAP